jgi:hypothetical protein
MRSPTFVRVEDQGRSPVKRDPYLVCIRGPDPDMGHPVLWMLKEH